MSTLTTTKAPAKRRGRPAKKAQAQNKTLIDILVDPTEKRAANDAQAAADQKDALVYAALKRLKDADEAAEAERRHKLEEYFAPVIRVAVAINRLRRKSGVIDITPFRVGVTGDCATGSFSLDPRTVEGTLCVVKTVQGIGYVMDAEAAVELLMRTAISFGVQIPQE